MKCRATAPLSSQPVKGKTIKSFEELHSIGEYEIRHKCATGGLTTTVDRKSLGGKIPSRQRRREFKARGKKGFLEESDDPGDLRPVTVTKKSLVTSQIRLEIGKLFIRNRGELYKSIQDNRGKGRKNSWPQRAWQGLGQTYRGSFYAAQNVGKDNDSQFLKRGSKRVKEMSLCKRRRRILKPKTDSYLTLSQNDDGGHWNQVSM